MLLIIIGLLWLCCSTYVRVAGLSNLLALPLVYNALRKIIVKG